ASASMCTLHGVTWLHVEHTPTCDFAKSARVKPTACNMARPGARSGPSNTSDECGLFMCLVCLVPEVPEVCASLWHITFVASVRLDQWLDIACLYKTRSEAQKACKLG